MAALLTIIARAVGPSSGLRAGAQIPPMPISAITTPSGTDAVSQDDRVLMEWSVHLLRQAPAKGLAIVAACTLAWLAGSLLYGSWVVGLAGAFLTASAVAEFALPVRYRVDESGASCSYGLARLHIEWARVRRMLDGGDSVRLSPFGRPSRLDYLRGVELRFAPDGSLGDRDSVIGYIRQHAVEIRANA